MGQKPIDKVQAKQTVVDMGAFSREEIKAMLDEANRRRREYREKSLAYYKPRIY